jgi:hypothetical protein
MHSTHLKMWDRLSAEIEFRPASTAGSIAAEFFKMRLQDAYVVPQSLELRGKRNLVLLFNADSEAASRPPPMAPLPTQLGGG